MTPEQIDALEAGPETDRLVAEAVGDGGIVQFLPSRNWTDAMAAAERAGLFKLRDNPPKMALLHDCHDKWYVYDLHTAECENRTHRETTRTLGEDDSGPMAICKAILRLHGDGQ